MTKTKSTLLTLACVALIGSVGYGFDRPEHGPLGLFDDWTGSEPHYTRFELRSPALNFREGKDSYIVDVELPGMKKEDISVTIKAGVLTISGERKDNKTETSDVYRIRESAYGSFSRSISLPDDADANKVSAEFDNGVLSVTIGRNAKLLPQQITIK
jgi:HSP20 family protein